jgi:hypothetical protein
LRERNGQKRGRVTQREENLNLIFGEQLMQCGQLGLGLLIENPFRRK